MGTPKKYMLQGYSHIGFIMLKQKQNSIYKWSHGTKADREKILGCLF
jgi:hypothetical protein